MDIARGAAIDSPSMIHTCDRSVIHFGEGASPALDFLLRLPPVAMLAVIVAGSCSDNGLLASRLDLAGRLPACACMYTSAIMPYDLISARSASALGDGKAMWHGRLSLT